MSRDRTVCLMRVRNEERWIKRSVEQTLKVAKTVILFDDASEDETVSEAEDAFDNKELSDNSIRIVNSPFRSTPFRKREVVNEVRDKNVLWYFAKANVDFDHVLCLDGDEMLSDEAVNNFPFICRLLDERIDVVTLPFIYLWDGANQRRVDGIYGNAADGHPGIRHNRVFTIKRQTEAELYDTYFAWDGSQGGFHCGSIPATRAERDGKLRGGSGRPCAFAPFPVLHFGYMHAEDRRKKFEFYTTNDPGNESEGGYRHIIGEPNIHAPGPVQLEPWPKRVEVKLNVGCGSRPMPGYVNTDVVARAGVDRICPCWDLKEWADRSVDEIQCHQVIEHLFPKDWPPTLDEFWRVLRPGGKLIISTPDFTEIAKGYLSGEYTINDVRSTVTATCPPFNSCDYNDPASYHRTVHSWGSLSGDLALRGFVGMVRSDKDFKWNMFVQATKPAGA